MSENEVHSRGRNKSGPDRSFTIFLQKNGKRPVWPRFYFKLGYDASQQPREVYFT